MLIGARKAPVMDLAYAITAEEVIRILRAREDELRRFGIRRLGIFGSVARGDARPDSDIDLVAELDPDVRVSLFDLMGLEEELGTVFGREVQILTGKIKKDRLRAHIEQDRVDVFP